MFMRSLRENTRWFVVILAVAFAGWLVFDWVASRDTAAVSGTNPVVGVINGQEIRYGQWSRILEGELAAARSGDRALTDEEAHQVEETAWSKLIDQALIEQEIRRLGIEVTDEEVRQAFRISPPPDLMRYPAFLTDGVFDYGKYQEFFADPTVDESLLLQIENYYRATLPRQRLAELLQDGIYMSDEELWRIYRDRNETAAVEYVAVNPAVDIPDSAVNVPDAAVRAYYAEHREEFERPATALVNAVSFSALPSSVDTTAALEAASSTREQILSGELSFAEAARAGSADSLSAGNGGALGRFERGQLLAVLDSVAFSLAEGDVSQPVRSNQGFHILQVVNRTQDSVTVSHILIPVKLSLEGEDYLFSQMDDLEGIALEAGLEAAADSLGVEITRRATVTDGFDFVPGIGSLGVGVDWAFDPSNTSDEVSDYFENATGFHMLELVEREQGGTFRLEEVRPQIEATLRTEGKTARARELVAHRLEELRSVESLEQAATGLGWKYGKAGPFTRIQGGGALGQATEALGAAFGAALGQVSGPWNAGTQIVALRVTDRTAADQVLFEQQKAQLRAQITFQLRQVGADLWLQALRDGADVADLRNRLNQNANDNAPPLGRAG